MRPDKLKELIMYIGLVSVTLFWGAAWPLGRIVSHALPPLFAALLRYSIALPLFVITAYIFERDILVKNKKLHIKLAILGILQITLYQFLFLTGVKYTSSSDATLIISVNPILTAIIAAQLYPEEKLSLNKIIGLITALLGVVVIFILSPNTDVENRWLGNSIIFMAALVWAIYTSFARPVVRKMKPLTFTAWAVIYGWFFLLIISLILYPNYFNTQIIYELQSDVIFALLFLAILAAAYANTVFNFGIRILGSSRTAVFVNLVPVFGIMASIIILSENFSFWYILAFALIITGVSLVNRANRIIRENDIRENEKKKK